VALGFPGAFLLLRLEMAFAGRVGIDMKLDDASQGNLGVPSAFLPEVLTAKFASENFGFPRAPIGKKVVFPTIHFLEANCC